MRINAISQLKAAKAPAGKYADGQGLWLWKRCKDGGSWVLRYSLAGNRREMGLGRWPDVGIAEARDRAAAVRRQVRDGLDPLEARRKLVAVRAAPVVVFTLNQAVRGAHEAKGNSGMACVRPSTPSIAPQCASHERWQGNSCRDRFGAAA